MYNIVDIFKVRGVFMVHFLVCTISVWAESMCVFEPPVVLSSSLIRALLSTHARAQILWHRAAWQHASKDRFVRYSLASKCFKEKKKIFLRDREVSLSDYDIGALEPSLARVTR